MDADQPGFSDRGQGFGVIFGQKLEFSVVDRSFQSTHNSERRHQVTATGMTDGELVLQATDGLASAYGELAERWSGRVLAMCHARTGRRAIAEELAQETLLRGFRSLQSIESPERFGSWICGIAHRVCLDWRKARQTAQVSLTADASAGLATKSISGSDQVSEADEQSHLLSLVAKLPDELREVLMMYYYEDVTYQQLADQLGVSVATVNSRLARARAMLRTAMGESDA